MFGDAKQTPTTRTLDAEGLRALRVEEPLRAIYRLEGLAPLADAAAKDTEAKEAGCAMSKTGKWREPWAVDISGTPPGVRVFATRVAAAAAERSWMDARPANSGRTICLPPWTAAARRSVDGAAPQAQGPQRSGSQRRPRCVTDLAGGSSNRVSATVRIRKQTRTREEGPDSGFASAGRKETREEEAGEADVRTYQCWTPRRAGERPEGIGPFVRARWSAI